jgi:hypothetical protein
MNSRSSHDKVCPNNQRPHRGDHRRGVEAGKARILVGPDAYVFDILTRLAPTHYYDVLDRLQSRIRARRASAVGA